MNSLTRNLTLASCMIAMTSPLIAQERDGPVWNPERRQEIKAQQSAYLTKRMSLSPEEAQRFWPIHNRFEDELEVQRKSFRETMKALKEQAGVVSEADAARLLDQRLAMQDNEQALRKRYDGEFRKAIGAVKTLELYRAERDFHREMLKRMQGKGPGGDRVRARPGEPR